MDREHVQTMVEKMKRVQHTLAGVLLSMDLAVEVFDTLSAEEREHYEQYWQEMHLKTIHDLNILLQAFTPGVEPSSQRLSKIEQGLRQAVSEAFTPDEIVQTLRNALQVAKEQRSPRDMITAILPTLEYTVGRSTEYRDATGELLLQRALVALNEISQTEA